MWSLCRASFWATLATYPIIVYHFGEVSWVALATNLVAVPFTTMLLLPTALAGLAVAAIWPSAGRVLIEIAVAMAQLLADACYWVESMVPLVVRSPLDTWELASWALAVGALLIPWRWMTLRKRVFAFLCFAAMLALLRGHGRVADDSALRVTFVEIGQGDAAVIEVPGGEVWLVDGGGLPFVGSAHGGDRQRIAESPARQALLPYLRHRGIDHIDLVVISHPHPDHYIGLQAVSRRMPISEVWSAHQGSASPGPYERWLRSLASTGTWVHRPPLGKARTIKGASLHVLWPRYREPNQLGDHHASSDPILSVNDNSLVVRLDFAGRRILFTGDIELEAEELLSATQAAEIRADVVKVPHHGSTTSSTQSFVSATGASLAVISCGRANHFGFPDAEVEARWAQSATYLLRTDKVGSITLRIPTSGQMQVSTDSAF
jgi:competence protein ComEC